MTTALQTEPIFSSTVHGTYGSNRLLIKLFGDAASFVTGRGPQSWASVATFVHEYLHYLHNLSTYAGVLSFISELRTLRLFIQTVEKNGRSLGSAVLSPNEQDELKGLIQWANTLRGGPGRAYDNIVSIDHVTDQMRTIGLLQGGVMTPRDVSVVTLFTKMKQRDEDQPKPVEVEFGTLCLKEAIAFEAELLMSKNERDVYFDIDTSTPDYPYRMARRLFERETGESPDHETLIKAALIALQSSDPGSVFLDVIDAYRQRNLHGLSPEKVILSCVDAGRKAVEPLIDDICTLMLDREFGGFDSRIPLANALAFVKKRCQEFMVLRTKDPFFELDFLRHGFDQLKLRSMLMVYPSCAVITSQPEFPDPVQMRIFKGADQEADERLKQEISVFQTAMDFYRAHTADETFQPTEKAKHSECPLAGACRAPLAIDSTRSHICKRTPWDSYDHVETDNCAYGTGVKVTWAGRPVIKRSDAT